MKIIAYTDGGCRGNPGIGGWGTILIDSDSGVALELAGGEKDTTNNRMEMTAAIVAMEKLKKSSSEILIYSDSKYLIDCCTKWMSGWKVKDWTRKGKDPLKNLDLLKKLDLLMAKHTVTWEWVKGHAGNKGNERADELANQAMDSIEKDESPDFMQRLTK